MEIRFNCESCGQSIRIDDACAGFVMKCAKCQHGVVVPASEPAPPIVAATASEWVEVSLPPLSAFLIHNRGDSKGLPGADVVAEESESKTNAEKTAAAVVPAAPLRCPFCLESARKRRTVCSMCGEPLPPTTSGAQRLLKTALFIAAVLLIGALAAAYSHRERRSRPKPAPQRSAVSAARLPAPKAEIAPSDTRFLTAARAALAEIQQLDSGVQAKLEHDDYSQKLSALASKLEALLDAAETSGLYGADADARQLCARAASIFFDYQQALNHWDLALLWAEEMEEIKAAQEATEHSADKLEQLIVKAKGALATRADLWAHAHEQGEAASAIFTRLAK